MTATLSLPSTRRSATEPVNTGLSAGSFTAPVTLSASAAMHDLSVDSRTLLGGHKSIAIVHNGATYRLQSTKLGKLILTK